MMLRPLPWSSLRPCLSLGGKSGTCCSKVGDTVELNATTAICAGGLHLRRSSFVYLFGLLPVHDRSYGKGTAIAVKAKRRHL